MYLDFLQNVLPNLVEGVGENIDEGAPPLFAVRVRDYLNETFPLRWIGRAGPMDMNLLRWCPRSPDLNPLDFYLWGHAKHEIYDKLNTRINNVEDLTFKIIEAI